MKLVLVTKPCDIFTPELPNVSFYSHNDILRFQRWLTELTIKRDQMIQQSVGSDESSDEILSSNLQFLVPREHPVHTQLKWFKKYKKCIKNPEKHPHRVWKVYSALIPINIYAIDCVNWSGDNIGLKWFLQYFGNWTLPMVRDIYLWIQHLQPTVGVDVSPTDRGWSPLFQDIQTIFRTASQLQTAVTVQY